MSLNDNASKLQGLAKELNVFEKIEIPLSRLDERALAVIVFRLNLYIEKNTNNFTYSRSKTGKYLCRLVREQMFGNSEQVRKGSNRLATP